MFYGKPRTGSSQIDIEVLQIKQRNIDGEKEDKLGYGTVIPTPGLTFQFYPEPKTEILIIQKFLYVTLHFGVT